ncbi:dual specificity protein phosphatase family protein [Halorhabdus sp. CUG00001]|uniref:protein-tyrosine phosphatase family protein n=1 Tax=Halorhabdus sp. CUG00001 TaxID=2600297 RepID=UPI00131B1C68|nr:dual specificity protein phosphatase family protein [Halorhabdus sp. CUG00001]
MAEIYDERVSAHRFAPAAPDEPYVYGACCPGWHSTADHHEAIDEWIAFMREHDVERVLSLLTGSQLDRTDANVARYREAFGDESVAHVPIPDHHLADRDTLAEDVLPFLEDAVEGQQRVVVHCLAGIGRVGHVLAAWLVSGRGYTPVEAVDTVREMGRVPTQAVDAGNARRGELFELLSTFE